MVAVAVTVTVSSSSSCINNSGNFSIIVVIIIVTRLINYWVNQQKEADDPSLAVNEDSDEASGECQIRQ